jgi:hypothetical protein
MTQIQTPRIPNIIAGPRGVGARSAGGAYSADAQQDLIDTDPFQGGPIELSGTTDVLNPQTGGNYVVKTGQANAMTLAAPRAGIDDGVTINVFSDTAFAHTITCPAAIIAAGVALKTVITFPAFRGGGVMLRAYNGVWQIVGQGFTAVGLA